MRVEVFDSSGGRFTIAYDGQLTRDRAAQLLDFVELLGGSSEPNSVFTLAEPDHNSMSKFDKVLNVVRKSFLSVWFSSADLILAFEREFAQPITLSTAATYLSRLTSRGFLVRAGSGNMLRYRAVQRDPVVPRQALSQ